jgi:hypothetical protein
VLEQPNEDWAETLLIGDEIEPSFLISALDNLITQFQERHEQLGPNPIDRIEKPGQMA